MRILDWRAREGENQALFREINEAMVRMANTFPEWAPPIDYVCECSDLGCSDRIRLSRPEYESVRRSSDRFAVAPDHDNPEIDRLVAENHRYAVVDLLYGPAVIIARLTDHRRDGLTALA